MTFSRSRLTQLTGAAACLVVVVAFGLLVTQDRSPLDAFDHWGRSAEDYAAGHPAFLAVLRLIEVAFATIGMIVWTTITAGVLLLRRRRRAAAFVVVVMIVTSLTTSAMKTWLGRGRPDWQDHTDLLSSKSFPSGHASSSAALAGALIVLVWMLVRREAVRWTATALLVLTWLVVCLDRVFLGRHFPTDVIAGSVLGVGVMLLGLVVFEPASERATRDRKRPARSGQGTAVRSG